METLVRGICTESLFVRQQYYIYKVCILHQMPSPGPTFAIVMIQHKEIIVFIVAAMQWVLNMGEWGSL